MTSGFLDLMSENDIQGPRYKINKQIKNINMMRGGQKTSAFGGLRN